MLCFADSELRVAKLRNPKRRSVHVSDQMSLLDPPLPGGSAPAWVALDDEQRAAVVSTLARLIAKVAVAPNEPYTTDSQESEDE